MSIAVITSIYGGYDYWVDPPEQTIEADWICVTDLIGLDGHGPDRWRSVYEPRPNLHPRLAAKLAKCCPWEYTDADTIVWVDGSCRFTTPDSLSQLIDAADGAPLAQFDHPARQCIYDEAAFSADLPKYVGQPIGAQAGHYRKGGHYPEHPRNWGLWATGLIVYHRRHRNSLQAIAFGRSWLFEQARWSYQDQISQAPMLRLHGLRPFELPGALHDNPFVWWDSHRSDL